jgi:hypothetical protein
MALKCFYDSFVFRMHIYAEKPAHLQAEKLWPQL